eukprot:3516299-Rhodomonas_salina.3
MRPDRPLFPDRGNLLDCSLKRGCVFALDASGHHGLPRYCLRGLGCAVSVAWNALCQCPDSLPSLRHTARSRPDEFRAGFVGTVDVRVPRLVQA